MKGKPGDGLKHVGEILCNGPARLRPPTAKQMRLIEASEVMGVEDQSNGKPG
jgi:hypothetical protein